MNILVTGAKGFVGKNLVAQLKISEMVKLSFTATCLCLKFMSLI